MKDELGEKTMAVSVTLRQKTYSYLTDDNDENKEKDTKTSVTK